MLPLHRALVQGAGAEVVSSLLAAHPEAARDRDARGTRALYKTKQKKRAARRAGTLPLHWAAEHGAALEVLEELSLRRRRLALCVLPHRRVALPRRLRAERETDFHVHAARLPVSVRVTCVILIPGDTRR